MFKSSVYLVLLSSKMTPPDTFLLNTGSDGLSSFPVAASPSDRPPLISESSKESSVAVFLIRIQVAFI